MNYSLHLAPVVQTMCTVKLCELSLTPQQWHQDKSVCVYCTHDSRHFKSNSVLDNFF